MDHEAICDCVFMGTCATYSDPLVGRSHKGPDGLGCTKANDIHRRKHCKAFTCQYLSVILSDVMGDHSGDASKA